MNFNSMKVTAITHLVNTNIRCPAISNVNFPLNDFALIEERINAVDKCDKKSMPSGQIKFIELTPGLFLYEFGKVVID